MPRPLARSAERRRQRKLADPNCRDRVYAREARKERVRENKAWLGLLRATGCCVDCKTPENLHFHHLHNKRFKISRTMSRTRATLAAEIAKCILLCASCHSKRHARQLVRNKLGRIVGHAPA